MLMFLLMKIALNVYPFLLCGTHAFSKNYRITVTNPTPKLGPNLIQRISIYLHSAGLQVRLRLSLVQEPLIAGLMSYNFFYFTPVYKGYSLYPWNHVALVTIFTLCFLHGLYPYHCFDPRQDFDPVSQWAAYPLSTGGHLPSYSH